VRYALSIHFDISLPRDRSGLLLYGTVLAIGLLSGESQNIIGCLTASQLAILWAMTLPDWK
jgi:hypothetical protein